MTIDGAPILDTFAEAFPMAAARRDRDRRDARLGAHRPGQPRLVTAPPSSAATPRPASSAN